MSSPVPSGSTSSSKPLGLAAAISKNKANIIQFFVMSGVLLLSIQSLGKKYAVHDLQEDISALKEEKKQLTDKMGDIKRKLLEEAAREPSGAFASRLRLLFDDGES